MEEMLQYSSNMRILALDTSTSMASLAITTETAVVAESLFYSPRSLSAKLVQEIDRLLTLADCTINDIDLFAASLGPGSFTGVRCGVATIQGLALATQKPCVGFSSLACLAMNFQFSGMPVCTILDARKNEVYAALYDCGKQLPTQIICECVTPIQKFMDQVDAKTSAPLIIAGEGGLRYKDILMAHLGTRAHFPLPCGNSGHAAAGACLAHATYLQQGGCALSSLVPHYIRPSDAELAQLAKTA